MAQSEVGNKSVAKTVENNEEEEDFGPQLIGKLEVNIVQSEHITHSGDIRKKVKRTNLFWKLFESILYSNHHFTLTIYC